MDIKQYVSDKAKKAKAASRALANCSTEIKNNALFKMAAGLEREAGMLIIENKKDLVAAEQKGLSKAMIDRLTLNPDRIKAMADGLREVAALPDPVGEVTQDVAQAQWHADRQDARAHRAHRDHLRIAAERDR